MSGAVRTVRSLTVLRTVACLLVRVVLQTLGRVVLLAVVLFLSLVIIVLEGSGVGTSPVNWVVPLLLGLWLFAAYLGHLRTTWVRRQRARVGPPVTRERTLTRRQLAGAAAGAAGLVVGTVLARTLAEAPVVILGFSIALGAAAGVLASDLLGRLGRLGRLG